MPSHQILLTLGPSVEALQSTNVGTNKVEPRANSQLQDCAVLLRMLGVQYAISCKCKALLRG